MEPVGVGVGRYLEGDWKVGQRYEAQGYFWEIIWVLGPVFLPEKPGVKHTRVIARRREAIDAIPPLTREMTLADLRARRRLTHADRQLNKYWILKKNIAPRPSNIIPSGTYNPRKPYTERDSNI